MCMRRIITCSHSFSDEISGKTHKVSLNHCVSTLLLSPKRMQSEEEVKEGTKQPPRKKNEKKNNRQEL